MQQIQQLPVKSTRVSFSLFSNFIDQHGRKISLLDTT